MDSGIKALKLLGLQQQQQEQEEEEEEKDNYIPSASDSHLQNHVCILNSLYRFIHLFALTTIHHFFQGDKSVNLIITDYFMPEMTGYDLLKRIKVRSLLQKRIQSNRI